MASRNLVGHRFGKLVLLEYLPRRGNDKHLFGLWQCDCGRKRGVIVSRVKNGYTRSCGCLIGKTVKHGMKGSSEYSSWQAMLRRCHNPSDKDYPRYGAKGIIVCAEWRFSFADFLVYVGHRPPGTSLDRIDGRRGYEPGNVRWATAQEQARNRKNAIVVESPKGRMPIVDYAALIGISGDAATLRLKRGKLDGCQQVIP